MSRRRLPLALAAAALVAAACAQPGPRAASGPAAPAPALEPLPARLRIGTSGDYAPFSKDGAGFDVEVAEAMARDLGVEIDWVPFTWPELPSALAGGAFDVAMSGVTWRPERAAVGAMTRAVAAGGPCVVGRFVALGRGPGGLGARIAVNRGGVLERFARERFPRARIRPVEHNAGLDVLLARGQVDLLVTDSFELPHLDVARFAHECEPAADRKVYWVSPARTASLAPRLDAWIASHEAELQALRARWLGGPAPRGELDHLVDLLARRLAYMPAVAAWKRTRGLPIEDPEREARVVEAARAAALAHGLAEEPVAELFRVQIELARSVQAWTAPEEPASLDLDAAIRPELVRLGVRIVASAARVAPIEAAALDAVDPAPLQAWLDRAERDRLRAALLALRPASR